MAGYINIIKLLECYVNFPIVDLAATMFLEESKSRQVRSEDEWSLLIRWNGNIITEIENNDVQSKLNDGGWEYFVYLEIVDREKPMFLLLRI